MTLADVTEAGTLMLLLPFLVIAMAMDIARRSIPNLLVVVMLGCGLVLHTSFPGGSGLPASLGGVLVGFLILVPFYALGGMGAGDVKLLAAAGSFLGPWGALLAGIFALAAGGVLALGAIAWRSLRPLLDALLPGRAPWINPPALRLPYSLAIAAGTFLAVHQVDGLGAHPAMLGGAPPW